MTATVVTGLLMLVGLTGIVVPVLPGLVLVAGSTIVWAWPHPDHRAWVVVGVAVMLYLAGVVTRYVVPGRRLRRAGVGTITLAVAVVVAVVGFFVVPVVGAPLGFVLAVYLAELARRRDRAGAWAATTVAVRGVALSMGVELGAAFLIVLMWTVALATLGPG